MTMQEVRDGTTAATHHTTKYRHKAHKTEVTTCYFCEENHGMG